MSDDEDANMDAQDVLGLAIQKGLNLTESIRTGIQQHFNNAFEMSPIARIPDIRSFSFGGTSQGKSDSYLVPQFVLPTRENCSVSSSSKKRMLMKDFGNINPALYQSVDGDDNTSFPEDHIGRLWFQLAYEKETEKLIVTIIKAKNLPCRGDRSQCDPFVRLCLVPDERRTLQTKVKRKTSNPRFEEAFVFPVTAKTIVERYLKFSVFDIDKRKKHILLGHAAYSLSDFDVNSDKHQIHWRDLDKEYNEINTAATYGELLISLCYNTDIERLTVNIVEGKSFRSSDKTLPLDSFVKVSLMHQSKALKEKKTQTVKGDPQPHFNESFQFKLSPSMCDAVSLLLVAEIHGAPKDKRCLGRVILGGFMFARGKELEHWQDTMQTEKHHCQQWHMLT